MAPFHPAILILTSIFLQLVLALVAVAAAKPMDKIVEIKPAVELKTPVVATAGVIPTAINYGYPVAHSLYSPITYTTSHVATAPVSTVVHKTVQPLATKVVKPVVYEAPKPVEIKPVVYEAPKPVEIKPVVYEAPKPMIYEAPKPKLEIKPVVYKTHEIKPVVYEAPKPVEIKPAVTTYVKPVDHKVVSPIAYATAPVASPVLTKTLTYNYQPVETKFVPKPYEVPVKKVEFVQERTACKNVFGKEVPCKKVKREAEKGIVYEHKPLTYATTYSHAVPAVLPTTYSHAVPAVLPTTYYTHAVPAVVPTATKVEHKVLPKKVHEIEVPQPVVKEYVQKVAIKPDCLNNYGQLVPCIDYE